MIYDCVIADSELDLLELRMKILTSKVDKFIVVEGNRSFSGKPKELHVKNNISRFKKIGNIECHTADLPELATDWQREFIQRNYFSKILDLKNDDITFISDLDEIPSPINMFDRPELSLVYYILQTSYYYINNVITYPQNHNEWIGTVRIRGKLNNSPQELRDARWFGPHIFGGYHWSYLGGPDSISKKISNFAHQEFNNSQINNKDNIKIMIDQGREVLGRDFKFKIESINNFPNEVLDYPQFIKYF